MTMYDRTKRRRCLFPAAACLVIYFLTAGALNSSVQAAAPSEDLGASLLDDSAVDARASGRAASASSPELPAARALLEPLRELDGERHRAPSQDDWLRLAKEHMQGAQAALAERNATGRASAMQREAVKELDSLLAKLGKQCQKCMSQCNSTSPNPNATPKPDKSGAKPGATTAEAGTSLAPIDKGAMARLVKDRWGRLPERQRDELLQPLSEEFVPEYAAETEAYFRALAEPRGAEDRP